MLLVEKVLRTKQAKEAIGEGVQVSLSTGDINRGINAMIQCGKRNGAYAAFKIAAVLDFVNSLIN